MRAQRMDAGRRSAIVLAAVLLGLSMHGNVQADVASDHPAAILIFPKLLVDTANGLDTVVRLSNVSDTELNVYCFYVNTTPQCSVPQGECFPDRRSCPVVIDAQTFFYECFPQWQPTDFIFRLTPNQPTGWLVSEGQSVNCTSLSGVCSNDPNVTCVRNTDCGGAQNRCVFRPCLPLDGIPGTGRRGPRGEVNFGTIPLSPEDPFIGELKCIAVDETLAPIARNDLIGEVIIGRMDSGPEDQIEVAGYNAIGIPAIPNSNDRDNTLVIGGPAEQAEYEGCPNVLILDHYADGAVDPAVNNVCQPDGTCSVSGAACATTAECADNRCVANVCTVTGTACAVEADCDNVCTGDICTLSGERCVEDDDCSPPDYETRVVTNLTLIPCTEDFENRQLELSKTVAQFLVFSEFEQRFSTSITVDCFKEIRLSNIGSATDNDRSIFSAGVLGTLTGQTRIRGVVSPVNELEGKGGNTLLGIAEEFRCGGPGYNFPLCNFVDQPENVVSATAKNLHFQGRRPQPDFVYLP